MDTITVDRGLAGPGVAKVHGVNPVFLLEKIIRERIQDSMYWKKECFQLNLLTVIDRIVLDIKLIATYYTVSKPSKFICLLLKLLQLQPSSEIVLRLLRQDKFKYLTAMMAVYIRITYDSIDVYELLEPLLKDYRKLVVKDQSGCKIMYMDELIELLLDFSSNKLFDLSLPRLTSRFVLEDRELIDVRESELQSEFEDDDDDEDENDTE